MFLGMQDFDFAQIQSNLLTFDQILPQFFRNFAQSNPNLPKSDQFCPKKLCLGMRLHFLQPQLLRHWTIIPVYLKIEAE